MSSFDTSRSDESNNHGALLSAFTAAESPRAQPAPAPSLAANTRVVGSHAPLTASSVDAAAMLPPPAASQAFVPPYPTLSQLHRLRPEQHAELEPTHISSTQNTDFFAAATALSELASKPGTVTPLMHQPTEHLSKAVSGALQLLETSNGHSSAAQLDIARQHLAAAAAVLASDAPELDLPAIVPGDLSEALPQDSALQSMTTRAAVSNAAVSGRKRPRGGEAHEDAPLRRSERSTEAKRSPAAGAPTNFRDNEAAWAAALQANQYMRGKRQRRIGPAERKVHEEGHVSLHHPKRPWTPQEDVLLRDAYVRITSELVDDRVQWNKIAELVPERTGKQCRDRWMFHLQPHVNRSAWTEEEDSMIFRQLTTLGRRWATIALALPGRTPQQIKNRYYASMRRLARQRIKAETATHPKQQKSQQGEEAEDGGAEGAAAGSDSTDADVMSEDSS